MTEEIIKGCEFQSGCIEYKDISYLKIMPICTIHELSIACHDKVNKCKYYKLYKQLSSLEQENKELKEEIQFHKKENSNLLAERNALQIGYDEIREVRECYRSALEEIRDIITNDNSVIIDKKVYFELQCGEPIALKLQKIYNKINEVLNENN